MNENSKVNVPDTDTLSMLAFVVAFVMWILTLIELKNDGELRQILGHIHGDFFPMIWKMVWVMWQASLLYKLWLISAVTSTVLCWCDGGFCALLMMPISFFLPILVSFEFEMLVALSGATWLFITGINILVVFLWLITDSIKEHLAKRKEVLPSW